MPLYTTILLCISIPLAAYIWILLRAADDDRTGWDREHPTYAPEVGGRTATTTETAGSSHGTDEARDLQAAPITLLEAERIVQAIRDLPETQVEEWLT